MNEFLFIFRHDGSQPAPSPEQMQASIKKWQDWMGGIAAQNKLSAPGNRLTAQGSKVLKPNNVVTDGPYVEMKEFVSGYILVKADSLEDAQALAGGCPIFDMGGSVEVRTIIPMNM